MMRPTFLPLAVLRPARFLTGLLVTAALASACSKPPPPEPPPEPPPAPEPVKEPEPPPPPPPPPKCEALSEKCAAQPDTRARIGAKGPSVAPPKGWTYAQEKDRTVLVSPAGDAMIAFVPAADATPEKALEAIDGALKGLEITNVKLPSLKNRLKKPQATADVDGIKLGKWEVDKKQQATKDDPTVKDKQGVVLIVHAPFASQPLVGVGIVTKADAKTPPDTALVSAMNASVDSLKGK